MELEGTWKSQKQKERNRSGRNLKKWKLLQIPKKKEMTTIALFDTVMEVNRFPYHQKSQTDLN